MTADVVKFRPGLENVEAAKSAISEIDGKRAVLEYRGIAVETLAKVSCYEETAWLLMKGDLPTQKQLAEFDHDTPLFEYAGFPAFFTRRLAQRSLRKKHDQVVHFRFGGTKNKNQGD